MRLRSLNLVFRNRQILNIPSTLQRIARFVKPWRSLLLLPLISLLLSGCIDSDIGIRFKSPSQGEIVQHLQVAERLRSFSDTAVQQWVETLDRQARSLGGRLERQQNQTWVVKVPFSDAEDLETKFNQFFSPTENVKQSAALTGTDLPEIESHLTMNRNNLFLIERNRLRYDVDLRSLGVASSSGNVLLSPGALIDLEFRLEAPWGSRPLASATSPVIQNSGNQLVWKLVPGELNHLEAIFWMPSPLGIGTVVIVLLVLGGMYLKSSRSAGITQSGSQ